MLGGELVDLLEKIQSRLTVSVFTGNCQISTISRPLMVPFPAVAQSSYALAPLLQSTKQTCTAQQRYQGAGGGSRTSLWAPTAP